MDARKRKKLESQLSAYLDGELTPRECREIEAFLADDAGIRALLDELRATVKAVGSLPRAQASDDLLQGLRGRLERRALLGEDQPAESAAPGTSPFTGRWLAAAAVIALTFVAAYFMWPLAQPEPQGAGTGPQYAFRDEPADEPKPPRSDDAIEGLALAEADTKQEKQLERKAEPLPLAEPATIAGKKPAREAGGELTARLTDRPSERAYGYLLDEWGGRRPPAAPVGTDTGRTTVVELAFADATSQQQAVEVLRSRYVSQDAVGALRAGSGIAIVAPAPGYEKAAKAQRELEPGQAVDVPEAGAVTELAIDVPSEQVLDRLVRSLESQTGATDLRVLARGQLAGASRGYARADTSEQFGARPGPARPDTGEVRQERPTEQVTPRAPGTLSEAEDRHALQAGRTGGRARGVQPEVRERGATSMLRRITRLALNLRKRAEAPEQAEAPATEAPVVSPGPARPQKATPPAACQPPEPAFFRAAQEKSAGIPSATRPAASAPVETAAGLPYACRRGPDPGNLIRVYLRVRPPETRPAAASPPAAVHTRPADSPHVSP